MERTTHVSRDGRRRVDALGPSVIPGWDLVYDHPEDHAQVIRREESTYALACTRHRHAKALSTQNEERPWRESGGWCPGCVFGLPSVGGETA
ncbi:hypothetical protein ACFVZC_04745 [Streptomyces marokkonensis]|uniref:Uncharacterized protein n=1 Tax=Streptomyces marokkonensis TaxID=324855 RepID=A0ABW6Q0L6_9ACTN